MAIDAADRNSLIMAAQTGDPAAIGHLLAVCQADARRYPRDIFTKKYQSAM